MSETWLGNASSWSPNRLDFQWSAWTSGLVLFLALLGMLLAVLHLEPQVRLSDRATERTVDELELNDAYGASDRV